MKCPICGSSRVRVTNVRERDFKVYRIRQCLSCGDRFTTWEVDAGSLMGIFENQFDLETSQKIASIIEKTFPVKNRRSEYIG